MLMLFWMLACGPSQEQLDCLSECDDRKSAFPGMSVCIEQQNETRRKQTIKELQSVLDEGAVQYASSKDTYQSYKKRCLDILNSKTSNPKAAAERYMALCEGASYDRVAPHKNRMEKYEKNEAKLKNFIEKSEGFNNSGGAEKACSQRKIEFDQINCEQECENK